MNKKCYESNELMAFVQRVIRQMIRIFLYISSTSCAMDLCTRFHVLAHQRLVKG